MSLFHTSWNLKSDVGHVMKKNDTFFSHFAPFDSRQE
ncbi:hypothetical protein predicted by Glimmer/Critica [Salmonella enterica subsp. enterica serovar Weltevreden str. 2007-60-3289-1]|nr:hypothetical protein Sesv_1623 [Salmonella enterica subsp. enterica serovar Virchow str. SVQ1]CBY95384.1 hypothetical protein predicted by Glimmer/Critica [Salmonella enterica subsp. enterica serovar Weltevreden str. 2007-60-3289-1]